MNTFLPLELRTYLIQDVILGEEVRESHQLMSLILISLLSDIRHFSLTASSKNGNLVQLESDDCDFFLQEISMITKFRMETFRLEGVSLPEGILSQILCRSPHLVSIHVSGSLCTEVLMHLKSHPCRLRSLQLDNSTVTDEEVVKSLLRLEVDFEKLGQIICSGGDIAEIENKGQQTLQHLSVQSPLLNGFGSIVLLYFLQGLRNIQYTSWNSSIFDTLLILQRVSSKRLLFSLTSIDLWRPTEELLLNLREMCPRLSKLMIECYDPTLHSLELLASFADLSALTLRLMSEDLIVSAVKSAGNNLRELEIEFETFTFHSISLETLKLIHEHCPQLQRLEMRHVCLGKQPGDHLISSKSVMFPNLKHLTLSSAVIQREILEKIIIGNNSLENLVLDVNQDAITDTVLTELRRNNKLDHLNSIFLGAGSLSPKGLTSLISLPSMKKLSLDIKRFPFIPVSTFSTLEVDLIKGNYLCFLENVLQDDI